MTSGWQGYREWGRFRQGVGENGERWEWREGVHHVGGKDVMKVTNSTRPGLEVSESAVANLSISLDEAVDIKGVEVVEEGTIL